MRVLACSIPVRRGVQRVVAVGVDGDQVALGRPVESGRGPHPVLLAGRRRTAADRPDRPGPIDRLGDRLPASAPQERQRSRLRAVGPRDQVARDGFGGHGRGSPGDLPWPRRGPRLSIGVIPGNKSYRCSSIILGPAGRGKCLDVVHRRARRRNRVLSRENPCVRRCDRRMARRSTAKRYCKTICDSESANDPEALLIFRALYLAGN